ncbi:MAG TPA: protein translocase subunit SecF [Bacteroidetes bacterium]|nr:protein translocase subunit SecF [Bacteroidota bacterium]
MQFFSRANIDFITNRKYGYMFSGTLLLIGFISLILRGGPNYGIDFKGGVSIRVQMAQNVTIDDVRKSLSAIGYGDAELKESRQEQGNTVKEEYIVRVPASTESSSAGDSVLTQLRADYGDSSVVVRSVESVGPKIGNELKRAAIYSILFALLIILIYISWRFELRFAVGAIIPLFHDVLITLGIFSVLNLEISLAVVAAFLTIVGYSLNDTIVVFDRIRENLRTLRREKYDVVINKSINETLSRTIITSLTTLFVVLILYFLGGSVIHNFAFALLVGVVIGTYSSIFVASPILIEWENWHQTHNKIEKKKKKR